MQKKDDRSARYLADVELQPSHVSFDRFDLLKERRRQRVRHV